MALEMYKASVVIEVKQLVTQQIYVFAADANKAKSQIDEAVEQLNTHKLKSDAYLSKEPVKTKVIKAKPDLVGPTKGRKRPALTKIQKNIIRKMLKSPSAQLLYSPKSGWKNTTDTDTYHNTVDIRTVVALRERGLIKPFAMTEDELKAQQAVGSMGVGEFAFVLNMDEVKKRKIYQDTLI